MAIKAVTKELRKLSFTYSTEEVTMFRTSDGHLFEKESSASKYENKLSCISKFEDHFSEKRGNFVAAPLDMVFLMIGEMEDQSNLMEYFWINLNNEKDKEIFIKSISEFYHVPLFYCEDQFKGFGWYLFTMFKTKTQSKGFSVKMYYEKSISERLSIIKNSLPDELLKTNKVKITKDVQESSGYLLDFSE